MACNAGSGIADTGRWFLSAALDREEFPGAGHAFEFVLTSILELDARSSNEVLHGRGDEHLSGFGKSDHSCSGVDGHSRHIIGAKFDLSGMQSSPHEQTVNCETIANG